MLLESGLKPVLSLFGWNRLPRLLAKLGAIFRNLIRRDTRILIRKVTPRGGASRKPSEPVAGMTSMMSSVATRVTTTPARVATSMSSTVPSSARKYRSGTEDKDYADD